MNVLNVQDFISLSPLSLIQMDGPGILGPVGLGTNSSVSSSFPQGLMNLNPGPPSPPKGFQGLPSQTGHVFNAMHSITTQLQSKSIFNQASG